MKYLNMLLPTAVIIAALMGCEKNEDTPVIDDYSKGVYIVNEGAYGAENGSISYFNIGEKTIVNGLFEAANNRPTGDVVQSFAVVNNTVGIIVVNNFNRLEIVELKTFKTIADPIGIVYPRYFMQVSADKGYVSQGQHQGYLAIIDLNSFAVTDSIQVGFGPENMLIIDDKVYVINSGGYDVDSTISVVDPTLDEVIETVFVGRVPSDMAMDENKNIWVYCKGSYDWVSFEATASQLMKINPVSKAILWQANVGMASDYGAVPSKMAMSKDGTKVYYLRPDGVYRVDASNPVLEANPLISGSYYGIEVNPSDGNIYVFESTSFTGNGKMKIFGEDGTAVAEGVVGIGPNGATFNLD